MRKLFPGSAPYYCFPTRHHHFVATDFNLHLLVCNFIKKIGCRNRLGCLFWSPLRITGLAFFELTTFRLISVSSAHLWYPRDMFNSWILSCDLRPKRCFASVSPMNS